MWTCRECGLRASCACVLEEAGRDAARREGTCAECAATRDGQVLAGDVQAEISEARVAMAMARTVGTAQRPRVVMFRGGESR